jgi:hypothetical protein
MRSILRMRLGLALTVFLAAFFCPVLRAWAQPPHDDSALEEQRYWCEAIREDKAGAYPDLLPFERIGGWYGVRALAPY